MEVTNVKLEKSNTGNLISLNIDGHKHYVSQLVMDYYGEPVITRKVFRRFERDIFTPNIQIVCDRNEKNIGIERLK